MTANGFQETHDMVYLLAVPASDGGLEDKGTLNIGDVWMNKLVMMVTV